MSSVCKARLDDVLSLRLKRAHTSNKSVSAITPQASISESGNINISNHQQGDRVE
jgi:hypothetical protein